MEFSPLYCVMSDLRISRRLKMRGRRQVPSGIAGLSLIVPVAVVLSVAIGCGSTGANIAKPSASASGSYSTLAASSGGGGAQSGGGGVTAIPYASF